MPSCDQTGVPGVVGLTHFHSSTTSGSASLMSARILPRVALRQSPSPAILSEMSSDADWFWPAWDFVMFSSSKFQTCQSPSRRSAEGNKDPQMIEVQGLGLVIDILADPERLSRLDLPALDS